MDIYEAYGELKARGLTRDQYDFSRTWLSRDRSYLSSLKARKRPASSETMIHLAAALTRAMVAARLKRLDDKDIAERAGHEIRWAALRAIRGLPPNLNAVSTSECTTAWISSSVNTARPIEELQVPQDD